MKRKLVSLFIVGTLAISACGSKKDINYSEDLADNNIEAASSVEVSEVDSIDKKSDDYGNSEDAYYKEGSKVMYADATVNMSENAKYPTVEISKKEYDIDTLREIADGFFDDGKYEQYLDVSQGNEEYVTERINRLERYKTELSKDSELAPPWIQKEIDAYNYGLYEMEYTNLMIKYSLDPEYRIYNFDFNETTGLCDAEYCFFEGLHGGELYKMKYYKLNDRTYIECYKPTDNYEKDIIYTFNNDIEDEEFLDSQSDNSINEVDVDEAKEKALEFIKLFGLDGYVVTEVLNTSCVNYDALNKTASVGDKDSFEYGYKILLAKDISGQQKTYHMENSFVVDIPHVAIVDEDVSKKIIKSKHVDEEYISVVVTKSGVSQITIINPMNVDNIVTEDSKLLPIEDIQRIAGDRFSEKKFYTFDNDVDVYEIKLGLGQVYNNGDIMLVPVWNYMYQVHNEYSKLSAMPRSVLTINAIDGTIVGEDLTDNLTKNN